MSFEAIKKQVGRYYSGKVKEHGATPKGVDWNSEESQLLRFEQLSKVMEGSPDAFSVLDFGCGYGSLVEFLRKKFPSCSYTGYDISDEMIAEARKKFPSGAEWMLTIPEGRQFDYVLASGIFNVRLQTSNEDWLNYILDTLRTMNALSEKGFSFNVLTKYSDKEYMRDDLYYADPGFLFDHCKKNFSKKVALLHDYPLYEFTILVKK